MSWSLYLFSLVGVMLLQGALVNQVDIRFAGVQPVDLFLVLMLIYALRVPSGDARLAAFGIGLLQDISGQGPVGAAAVSFGLGAALLVLLRENLRTSLWVARFVLAIMASLVAQTLLAAYALFWLHAAIGGGTLVLTVFATSLVASLFAASLPPESDSKRTWA